MKLQPGGLTLPLSDAPVFFFCFLVFFSEYFVILTSFLCALSEPGLDSCAFPNCEERAEDTRRTLTLANSPITTRVVRPSNPIRSST